MKKSLFKRFFACLISAFMFLGSNCFKINAYTSGEVLKCMNDLNFIYYRYKDFETKRVIDETMYALMDMYELSKNMDTLDYNIGDDAQEVILARLSCKFKHDHYYKKFFKFDEYKIDTEALEPIINLGKDDHGVYWVIANDLKTGELSFEYLGRFK